MDEQIKEKLNTQKENIITKLKDKGNALLNWSIDHPIQASFLIALVGRACKGAMRERRNHIEDTRRQMREYDPSLGLYYDLRRSLTNKEKLELSKRHQSGESIGDILQSFRVLK